MQLYPTDAVLSANDYCNCKCIFCNIWKQKPEERKELPLAVFNKLPSSLKTINITGGEPFLRGDLEEIFRILKRRCHSAVVTISSNGILSDRICNTVQSLLTISPRFRIAFSIEGLGELHNKMRGIPNAFRRLEKTLDGLKSMGYTGTRLGMVIVKDNVDALPEVYDFARLRGLELGFWLALDSEFYFHKTHVARPDLARFRKSVRYVILKEISSIRPKHWLRAYFAEGLIDHMEHRDIMRCTAGIDSFFVNATSDLYPCIVLREKIGNLAKDSFEQIWTSAKMARIRSIVLNCKKDCRMICTARANMRQNWKRVLWWIIKNKIKKPLFQ